MPGTTTRPVSLTVAAVLVALEGLAVLVLAAVEVADLTSGRLAMGVSTTVFLAAYGGALLGCGWGLARRRSWARGPAVLAQLIQLGLAWNFRGEATVAISVVLAVSAVVALVAIFARPSLEALDSPED